MKLRMLVMNGQRILETENNGVWTRSKVDKAPTLKPGIYNLHTAKAADKSARSDGMVLLANAQGVYQQTSRGIVLHEKAAFDKVPTFGEVRSISYEAGGRAQVASAGLTATRSRTL